MKYLLLQLHLNLGYKMVVKVVKIIIICHLFIILNEFLMPNVS